MAFTVGEEGLPWKFETRALRKAIRRMNQNRHLHMEPLLLGETRPHMKMPFRPKRIEILIGTFENSG